MTAQVVAVKPGTRVPEVAAVDERFRVAAGASQVILELVQADPKLERQATPCERTRTHNQK
ncbi:MAG TPA: hypothetical protein VNE82_07480 [Candidatus Binataceae bacterium]|nr:hypothetical protein [Candidatus Binataceae bacterium]